MCQPGRPRPQGLVPAGLGRVSTASTGRSPSGRACRARPRRGRRRASRRASGRRSGRSRGSSRPRRGRGPRPRRRGRAAISVSIIATIWAMYSVARGSWVGGSAPSAAMSSWYQRGGLVGDLADRAAGLGGAGVDLVVDVGDVADVGDVVRAVDVAEQAEEHVEDDDRAGVADMGAVVDGRAADVHRARCAGSSGTKRLLACGSGCCRGVISVMARASRLSRGGLSRRSGFGNGMRAATRVSGDNADRDGATRRHGRAYAADPAGGSSGLHAAPRVRPGPGPCEPAPCPDRGKLPMPCPLRQDRHDAVGLAAFRLPRAPSPTSPTTASTTSSSSTC